jgi:hypothetical protein
MEKPLLDDAGHHEVPDALHVLALPTWHQFSDSRPSFSGTQIRISCPVLGTKPDIDRRLLP